jgi:uncharacterized membrane protein YozB (DUF420 family)
MTKLYNYLVKDGDAIAVGLSAVLFIVFALSVFFGAQSGGYDLSTLTDMPDKSNVNIFNVGLWMMIILGIIAIILMVIGVFWDLFRNFKSGSKSMIGMAVILIAFLILYFTSSHDTGGRYAAYWSNPEFHINESISKFISAGLYSLMGLTVVAFALILFYEIKSFFR